MRNTGELFGAKRPSQSGSPAFKGVTYRRSRKTMAACCILCCAILCASSARAQQPGQTDLDKLSIEDLAKMKVDSVYGASKFLQKLADAPASITIVKADEIQRHGWRTLADVLRSVRGFYVINDRNYTYVGVRGFSRPGDYNSRILFLLDGHRENDNIFDGAYVGTEFPVDVDLIERIEIIRGPSSSVYGTGAFVAVINVITKRGRDLGSAEVSAAAGSWNSNKGRVSYGDRLDNGLESLLSGSFSNSLGHKSLFFPEFDSPATNNGIAEHADADQSYNAFADVIYRDFNVHFVQGSRTKHIPTASFGTVFNDPRTQTTDARGYIDLQYKHTLGNWETLGRVSYDWYDYHGIYIYDYSGTGVPPFTQNYDAANGTWWDLQGDVSRVFFQRHRVTFGTEFRQDLGQHQTNYDIQPYLLYLDDHRSARVLAFYFQDEYSILSNLALFAGLRDDWYNKFGTTLSPRVGLIYKLGASTDVKVMFSRAFRAPNSYESFYSSGTATANPLLLPERIQTWELDVEHRFNKIYYASSAGFMNRINNAIEQGIDPVTNRPAYTNASPVHTTGLELELGARWPGGVEGNISHSLQDSRNAVGGNVLANSPKQLGKVNLSVPVMPRKVFASFEAQYTSVRRTIAQTDLGGFFVMNATLFTRRLKEDFDLSASLYNLFDKRYADSGGVEHVQTSIPQDGRSFRVKLTYRPRLRAR